MICGSGPRPDPESFAFCIFDEFFMDPDPGSCHTQQLQKNLNMIFERKPDPRQPLDGSGHVFTI
jgi:hypothetical protein